MCVCPSVLFLCLNVCFSLFVCIPASGEHSSMCLVILMTTTYSLFAMPFIMTHVVVFNVRNETHMLEAPPCIYATFNSCVLNLSWSSTWTQVGWHDYKSFYYNVIHVFITINILRVLFNANYRLNALNKVVNHYYWANVTQHFHRFYIYNRSWNQTQRFYPVSDNVSIIIQL